MLVDDQFVRNKIRVLLKEARMGSREAKIHAQLVVQTYMMDYELPGGIEFYNALNFCLDPEKLDWGWLSPLDKTGDNGVKTTPTPFDKCSECCHRMLVSALYGCRSDIELRDVYLSLAADRCPDWSSEEYIRRCIGKEGDDMDLGLERILYEIDAELTKPEVNETETEQDSR